MKNYLKKGLAFLLVCAMSFGEFLPVSAASPSEPVAVTGEENEEVTQVEQKVENTAPEGQQNPEEIPADSEESTEPEAAEPVPEDGNETSETEEEVLQIPEENVEIEAQQQGENQTSVITLSNETTIPVESEEEKIVTPSVTGYYKATWHNARTSAWMNYSWGGMVSYVPEDIGMDVEVQEARIYYLEKGNNYGAFFSQSTDESGNIADCYVTIKKVPDNNMPKYTDMKPGTTYTIAAGEKGLFKISNITDDIYLGIKKDAESLFFDSAVGLPLRLDREDGLDWYSVIPDGLEANDCIYFAVLADEGAQTVQYANELGLYESIDNWDGEIELQAGETRYFEFYADQAMDYLIETPDGVYAVAGRYTYLEFLSIESKNYAAIAANEYTMAQKQRFSIENDGQETATVKFLTGEEIAKEVPINTEAQKNPYFIFKAPESGIYFIEAGGSEDYRNVRLFGEFSSAANEFNCSNVYSYCVGIALKKDETISGYCSIPDDSDATFSISKREAIEKSGLGFTIEGNEDVLYKFTPSKSGRCWLGTWMRYFDETSPLPQYPKYERRNGEGSYYLDVEKGKDYYFKIDAGHQGTVIGLDKEIRILDYDYYNAFIASGGSVTVNEDRTVTVDGSMVIKGQKGKITATLLNIFGAVAYGERDADAFAAGNVYWRLANVGEFAAKNFYRLNEQNKPERLSDGTEVEDGDVVLVEYRPEIVWAQSVKLQAPTAALEPGDSMPLTPIPDYDTNTKNKTEDAKYLPEDTDYGATQYTWKSSNESVISVDEEGRVTAHKAGTATVTVYADELLRRSEGLKQLATASVKITVANPTTTYTTLKTWSTLTLDTKKTVNYSFTSSVAGDYLIERKDGITITPNDMPDGVAYQENIQVAGKSYACITFESAGSKTCKFSLKNTADQKERIELVTPLTGEGFLTAAALGENTIGDTEESIVYYAFKSTELGIYSIEGEEAPRWVCNEKGDRLNPESMILLNDETCYISYAGGADKRFSLAKDESSELVAGDDKKAVMEPGVAYLYRAEATGKCTAFTSRLYQDDVTLTYDDGTGLKEWAYDAATGNYSMNMTKDKIYSLSLDRSEGVEIPDITVGIPGYNNKAVSSAFKIGSLKDEDLAGIGSASRMSAAYKISQTNITASGTLEYIKNCKEHLGANGSTYEEGYFLAFRLNVQKAKFKEDGYVCVTYTGEGGQRCKAFYEAEDIRDDGNIDVILNMNQPQKEVQIRVALDAATNIKTYTLNMEGVKQGSGETAGRITEPANLYGIKTSSPVIGNFIQGYADYKSVAYSANVTLPNMPEETSGNYIALKVEIPDSMKNTNVTCKVSGPDGGDDGGIGNLAYLELPEENPYVLLVLEVHQGFEETINLTWTLADAEGNALSNNNTVEQGVYLYIPNNCYIETIPEKAVLPKSIAFNGLASSMYVGQTQNIETTINKKYEGDLVRLSYSSSDNSILSVNRVTGEIYALKAGTATVTVEAVALAGGKEQSISKSSKITVKNPTAPGSVKISGIKDTHVTVSWAKNVTGQSIRVYAVPYDEVYDAKTRKSSAQWKAYIEAAIEKGVEEGSPEWIDPVATVDPEMTQVEVEGLTKNTPYLFYVRNFVTTGEEAVVYAGTLSGKAVTTNEIFDKLNLKVLDAESKELSGSAFVIENWEKPGDADIPAKITYILSDNGSTLEGEKLISSVSYKSSNTKVIKINENGNLTLGGEAGKAVLSITGKDASGTVRTSDNEITVTVKKAPEALKAKTTTLAIGESISLKELINYSGVKGAVSELDTEYIDFDEVLNQIPKEYFVWNEQEEPSGDTRITAAALVPNKKGVPASGGTVKVADFVLAKMDEDGKETVSTAEAKVKINDMSAPAIKSMTPGDTSAIVTFTANTTVKELTGENYYYTVTVKDMVTNGEVELRQSSDDGQTDVIRSAQTTMSDSYLNDLEINMTEASDTTVKNPVHTCEICGLSSNKKYRISITAHYDVELNFGGDEVGLKQENKKASGTKDFTTKNRLLASEDQAKVSYISLTELKRDPYNSGSQVFENYNEDKGIILENNETYVFMAHVSYLARTLETDKIKWTISSGDTKAATIKPSSSTFEAQLKAVKTGKFTVTAASTVTKEVLTTFTVTVIPYQSANGSENTHPEATSMDHVVAYLGGGLQEPFREDKKKTA